MGTGHPVLPPDFLTIARVMHLLDSALLALVVFALVVVSYTYLGYPVVIWAASRLFGRRPRRPVVSDGELPTVSLVIAAYNEEAEIAGRIANALAVDYPAGKFEVVIASDG